MEQGVPVGQARPRAGTGVVSRIEVHLGIHHAEGSVGHDLVVDRPFPGWISIPRSVPRVAQTSGLHELSIRAMDLAGAMALLVCALPVMLLAAVLIKVFSPGPILYKQERVGKGGTLFMLYKFRSMINDAEKHVGPVWAAKDDDRVTPIGRILRKMRLDELPQLFNVLKGDMSLVGPRPERPFFVRRHKVLQGVRLAVRPGLTGLAQIRAFYDLRPEHKLKYDCLYIQNRSFLLNLSILLKTIPVVIRKTGW